MRSTSPYLHLLNIPHDIDNIILQNYGRFNNNSLLHLVDSLENNVDEEPNILLQSQYIDNETLTNILHEKQKVFKVLSLNCQSLSAKLDQLKLFLYELALKDLFFDVICLQETWTDQNIDISYYNIDNYELFHKPKTSSLHGGLATYVRKEYISKAILSGTDYFETWVGNTSL